MSLMGQYCLTGGTYLSHWWDTCGTPDTLSLLFSLDTILYMSGSTHGR